MSVRVSKDKVVLYLVCPNGQALECILGGMMMLGKCVGC